METRGYIGIDFGTTNSHFAYSELNEGPPRATPITLDGAERSLSTSSCVLWTLPARTEADFFLYGDKGIEEWLMMDAEEQRGHRFAAGFKPDLATSERARLDAWAFLRQAYLGMRRHRTPPLIGDAEGMPVVIGVPAAVKERHRAETIALAEGAGFGAVTALAEPLGALAYHLAHGQLSEAEVEKGVLVVDFGGGTLDIAWLDLDGVREPWGDPLLGGRLFDDLFFQWVTETSASDLAALSESELLYAWMVGCRQLKERFSRHWANRRAAGESNFQDFRGRAEVAQGQTLGVLRDASLDEFLARARAYRPSAVAHAYFEQIGSDLRHLAESGPVDLMERIRGTIASGPSLSAGRDYGAVILTGGSSSWPFMSDLVSELFEVPAERILCAGSPELTIGEGIALYHVLRERHGRARRRIRDELPELRHEIHRHVDRAAEDAAANLTTSVLDEVMGVARQRYLDWHSNGGRLVDAEAEVRAEIQHVPLEALAQDRLTTLSHQLQLEVHEIVRAWLRRHQISHDEDAERPTDAQVPEAIRGLTLQLDIGEAVGAQVTRVLSVVVAAMVATISGGGGVALVASGPLGLAIGAAIGGAAVFAGQGKVRKALREHDFQGAALVALRRLYSRAKLEDAMRESEQELRTVLLEPMQQEILRFVPALQEHAMTAADAALKRFDVLERLAEGA